jgi:MFS family permease
VRGEWGVVAVVAYAVFMDYFIYGLIVPLTPYSSAGTLSENHMALLYGSYAAGVLLATPLFGYLGDRVGCKRPMLIGVALSAVATLLFWSASGFVPLIMARLFLGAASAAPWIAGLALVAKHYPIKRVEMIGFALMGSTAGSLVGPTRRNAAGVRWLWAAVHGDGRAGRDRRRHASFPAALGQCKNRRQPRLANAADRPVDSSTSPSVRQPS